MDHKWMLVLLVLIYIVYCTDAVRPRGGRQKSKSAWIQEKSRKEFLERRQQKAKFTEIKDSIKKRFRPTSQKCCKLGEKVARKRLSCNVDMHRITKNKNLLHKAKIPVTESFTKSFTTELTIKMAKCGSQFPKYFEKCCHYRARFVKEMDNCKQSRYEGEKKERRLKRRKCRKVVMENYS